MTHTVLRNTRFFGAVAVGASQQASWFSICSVPIERRQASYTTHRVEKSCNLGYIAIVAALGNFSQDNSASLDKFEQVSAPTFEAIGGAV